MARNAMEVFPVRRMERGCTKKNYIFDTEPEMAYHKDERQETGLHRYVDADGRCRVKS